MIYSQTHGKKVPVRHFTEQYGERVSPGAGEARTTKQNEQDHVQPAGATPPSATDDHKETAGHSPVLPTENERGASMGTSARVGEPPAHHERSQKLDGGAGYPFIHEGDPEEGAAAERRAHGAWRESAVAKEGEGESAEGAQAHDEQMRRGGGRTHHEA